MAGLVAPALGLAAALSIAAPEEAARFYEEARKQWSNGEVSAAVIELKNALQLDPDHLSARLLLGQIYS